MKHIKLYSILSFLLLCITGCNKDYLNTVPKDKLDANLFFNTAKDLEVYTNGFYSMLPTTDIYDASYGESSDDIVPLIVPDRIKGTRIVPVPSGSGSWSWSDLRTINYFLTHYQKCRDEEAKLHYGGVARFFRAYFYYDKVKKFGDVPWYNHVLNAGDEDLYKPRDPRALVMDSVLADLNFAIENLPAKPELNQITKFTALALKSRVCLFEGTYRKYHNLGDDQKFLTAAVDAAEQLITSGTYHLYTKGGPETAYRDLFARNDQTAEETILARDYNPDFTRHNLSSLMTSPTQGAWGMTKDLVNSYLMIDGTPFTDIPGYDGYAFYEEMQHRDPRLTQSTAGPHFKVYGETTEEPVNLRATTTGYRIIKALATRDQWSSSFNDVIIFRLGEVLLNYAEAKAELGTLTQDDLNLSINKLRDRVGMPHLQLDFANGHPDPFLAAMYPHVSSGTNKGAILEIRRERRVELFNEGFRWDDLMRWKEGKKLEKPMVGMYFPSLGAYDFNGDGKADVYVYSGDKSGAPAGVTTLIDIKQRPLTNGTSGNLNPFKVKVTFDEHKDYLYPLPVEDLKLNDQLVQNPGWQ
ncbi:MAG TPA: RagB/SusD family nutrient uptake outer membrane protein [Arachidicoccus sp.]|nr:RagB/SusD family nutrient uptake outer membrane protein [Arachidicoccus sp.]